MVTTVVLCSTKGIFWPLKKRFEVGKDQASESLANIASCGLMSVCRSPLSYVAATIGVRAIALNPWLLRLMGWIWGFRNECYNTDCWQALAEGNITCAIGLEIGFRKRRYEIQWIQLPTGGKHHSKRPLNVISYSRAGCAESHRLGSEGDGCSQWLSTWCFCSYWASSTPRLETCQSQNHS